MSRIGKNPISIPAKVKVNLGQSGQVDVEGPKGKLSWTLPKAISAKVEGEKLQIERADDSRQTRAFHGLARALVANMVHGVDEGFKAELEIQGVGFRAAVKGKQLDLSLGKSHPILFDIPSEIKITVNDNTKILIEGIDKQVVGQVAANIRGYYPPEPYKGKGIRFAGEQVRRKEGKTVQ